MKYLIFAHARTGSSTLSRVFNRHPGIHLCQEPFQMGQWVERPSYSDDLKKEVPKNVERMVDLEFSINRLSRQFNCIKHVYTHLNRQGNERLLRHGSRIIFLGRKNLLRAAVSSRISRHMNEWGNIPETWRSKFDGTSWDPFNLNTIRNWIRSSLQDFSYYRSFIRSNHISCYELQYEDLFAGNISIQDKIAKINDIFGFLGLDPVTDPTPYEKIIHLLDPKAHKLNSMETYKKIPNIMEIETRLGSDETGWLFK